MSEEREPNRQETLARKIARVKGIEIDQLILSLKGQEEDDPDFQQYLEEREIEIETTIQCWEREIKQ
ncbi:hypothetical protein KAT95_01575 [Candidatus Parcubacteria bacterium]|nr:hypothetical protein [Candidatus Parcubacteria bacterium]